MTATRWTAALVAALMLFLAIPITANAQATRKTYRLYTGAAGDTTAVGMADSTLWLSTAAYQRLYLRLKPNKPCRVAIQIREAGNFDTSAVVNPDTTNMATWPWRAYIGAAGVLNNQTDSTTWIELTRPTSVVGGEDEMVYEFGGNAGPVAGDKWGGPRAKVIPICKVDNGEWYWGQFTQIRLRVLSSSGVVTWSAQIKGISW